MYNNERPIFQKYWFNIHNIYKLINGDRFHVNVGKMWVVNIGVDGENCKQPNINAYISPMWTNDLQIFPPIFFCY